MPAAAATPVTTSSIRKSVNPRPRHRDRVALLTEMCAKGTRIDQDTGLLWEVPSLGCLPVNQLRGSMAEYQSQERLSAEQQREQESHGNFASRRVAQEFDCSSNEPTVLLRRQGRQGNEYLVKVCRQKEDYFCSLLKSHSRSISHATFVECRHTVR